MAKRNKEFENSNKEQEKKIEDLNKINYNLEQQNKLKEKELLQRQKELEKSRNLFCFVCFIMCGMLIFGIWFYKRNFDVEKMKIDARRFYQRNFDVEKIKIKAKRFYQRNFDVEKMKIKAKRMIKRYL